MLDEKNNAGKVKWLRNPKRKGEFLFTIDGERVFNLFRDYPHELTEEEKLTFDTENPYWADFFKDRK